MPEFIEDTNTVQVYGDGSARFGVKLLLTDVELDQARHGYLCFTQCGENWAGTDIPAFPPACPVCGNDGNTPENFVALYQGVHDTGSQIDWDKEEERLVRQREERELAEGLRSRGIYLPRSI